jgi:mannose-6-phosphate isomerase-like protein (cupin superfamily)
MTLTKKNFNKPDETQSSQYMKADTIKIGEMAIVKQTYQPDWRWSKHVKPLAKTDSCQVHHFGVLVSGRLGVKADDGKLVEIGPGDVADIPPGHDGWVIGEEPAVFYTFTSGSAMPLPLITSQDFSNAIAQPEDQKRWFCQNCGCDNPIDTVLCGNCQQKKR